MPAVIFDLDNCISDDEWRIEAIDWRQQNKDLRYHDYHTLAPFDELRNADALEKHKGDQLIIFTARPVVYRASTLEWLKRKGVEFEAVFMRPSGNQMNSAVLKAVYLAKLLESIPEGEIVHAYDDRPEVIAFYSEAGVPSTVLSIHTKCAYTRPDAKSLN